MAGLLSVPAMCERRRGVERREGRKGLPGRGGAHARRRKGGGRAEKRRGRGGGSVEPVRSRRRRSPGWLPGGASGARGVARGTGRGGVQSAPCRRADQPGPERRGASRTLSAQPRWPSGEVPSGVSPRAPGVWPCARPCALARPLRARLHGCCVGRPAALDTAGWGEHRRLIPRRRRTGPGGGPRLPDRAWRRGRGPARQAMDRLASPHAARMGSFAGPDAARIESVETGT